MKKKILRWFRDSIKYLRKQAELSGDSEMGFLMTESADYLGDVLASMETIEGTEEE